MHSNVVDIQNRWPCRRCLSTRRGCMASSQRQAWVQSSLAPWKTSRSDTLSLRDFTPCIVRLCLVFLVASFPRSFLISTLVSHLHYFCALRISTSFFQQCKTQIRWKPEPFCYIFLICMKYGSLKCTHAFTHARTQYLLNLVGYWLSIISSIYMYV